MKHRLGRRGFLKTLGALLAALGMSKTQAAKAASKASVESDGIAVMMGRPSLGLLYSEMWASRGISAARVRAKIKAYRDAHESGTCLPDCPDPMHTMAQADD